MDVSGSRGGTTVVVLFLVLCALALFLVRLSKPRTYIFDEVYHAYTAGEYVAGNADAFRWDTQSPRSGVAYMWNHPPMGVWMIASGIRLWGNNSFGWRFASAVFGALGVALLFLMALSVTRSPPISMLAACLLLMDGLFLVQSRVGMLDIFGTVFMLCALWAFYVYLRSKPRRLARPLVALGFFLGLAIATKWNAGIPSLVIGLIVLGRAVEALVRFKRTGDEEAGFSFRHHLKWIPIALIACPGLVYLVAYAPFFALGNGWADFVELQKQIFLYHTGLEDSHPGQSSWWQWPLSLKPVWYSVTYGDGWIANIYAQTNPLLSWLFLPAVVVAAWSWRSDKAALTLLLVGFFGQWLPWAGVSRISFAYHFLPAVPFGCLALATSLALMARRGRTGIVLAAVVVLSILLSFFFFYPIHASVPLTPEALEMRRWFPSWR